MDHGEEPPGAARRRAGHAAFLAAHAPRFLLPVFVQPEGDWRVFIDVPPDHLDEAVARDLHGHLAVWHEGGQRWARLLFSYPPLAAPDATVVCAAALRDDALTVDHLPDETLPPIEDSRAVLRVPEWTDAAAIEEFLELADLAPPPEPDLRGTPARPPDPLP